MCLPIVGIAALGTSLLRYAPLRSIKSLISYYGAVAVATTGVAYWAKMLLCDPNTMPWGGDQNCCLYCVPLILVGIVVELVLYRICRWLSAPEVD